MRSEGPTRTFFSSLLGRPLNARFALSVLLCLALVFRVALVPLLRHKQTHDSRIFVSWAQLLTKYGSHGLYRHIDTIDHYTVNYPPLFAVVLGLVNGLYAAVNKRGSDDLVLLAMLLKLPAIIADIALCGLIFVIVRRWVSPRAAFGAVAFAAFAPSTWPISTLWGQVDSICTAFLLLALTLVFERRYTLAWSALALAVLIKPLPAVLAPVLLATQLRDQRLSFRLSLGPLCGIVIAYAVALPFAPTAAPVDVLRWLAALYSNGQSLSDLTSVNAYNLWTFAWPVTSDANTILGISLHAWGWLAFATIVLPTSWTIFVRMEHVQQSVAREQLITRAWFLVLVALFMLDTRMHERYILFALTLAPLMWFCRLQERAVAVTLLATFTICVVLVLGFYEHAWLHEASVVTHFISLVNLGAFGVLVFSFYGEKRNRPAAAITPAQNSRT